MTGRDRRAETVARAWALRIVQKGDTLGSLRIGDLTRLIRAVRRECARVACPREVKAVEAVGRYAAQEAIRALYRAPKKSGGRPERKSGLEK